MAVADFSTEKDKDLSVKVGDVRACCTKRDRMRLLLYTMGKYHGSILDFESLRNMADEFLYHDMRQLK